jgi:hypothetical protein
MSNDCGRWGYPHLPLQIASGNFPPLHEPASREGARGEVSACEGSSKKLRGLESTFERGGSPFCLRRYAISIQPVLQPTSPLRRRMLEDMARRGLHEETQRGYVQFARSFAAFLTRPLGTATPEDTRQFQVHQAKGGVQPPTINCSVSVMRFIFTVTLDRPDLSCRFMLVRHPGRGACSATRWSWSERSSICGMSGKDPQAWRVRFAVP